MRFPPRLLGPLMGLSLTLVSTPSVQAKPVNTKDTVQIPSDWLNSRVYEGLKVDPSGVIITLRTGEKVGGLTILPWQHVDVKPLNGQLCAGGGQCNGTAPTIIQLFRKSPQRVKGLVYNADGTSLMTITTNAGNTYQFRLEPTSVAPKRKININSQ